MQCLLSIFGAASRTRCLCCYLPCACVLESSQVLLVESCSLESVRVCDGCGALVANLDLQCYGLFCVSVHT